MRQPARGSFLRTCENAAIPLIHETAFVVTHLQVFGHPPSEAGVAAGARANAHKSHGPLVDIQIAHPPPQLSSRSHPQIDKLREQPRCLP
jgi:hypothetical protein